MNDLVFENGKAFINGDLVITDWYKSEYSKISTGPDKFTFDIEGNGLEVTYFFGYKPNYEKKDSKCTVDYLLSLHDKQIIIANDIICK